MSQVKQRYILGNSTGGAGNLGGTLPPQQQNLQTLQVVTVKYKFVILSWYK